MDFLKYTLVKLFMYFETGFKREIRHPRLAQRVVNRWLLAVTLLRNPTLIQYRHHSFSVPIEQSEVDTSSVAVLVDSMI